jgi:uncharacterized protein involved in exopolysaccharide biosynthesis
MEPKNSLIEVLKTLFKWKKEIVYVCVAAVVGTAIISLFLPNYYQAVTVFLAVSPDQAKPEALYGKGQLRTEYYGNENDIDRILTIASSTELADYMIDSFGLYEHYKIKPGTPKAAYKVRRKFAKLYDVTKTKRDAIELTVEDKDKELATRMAAAARKKIEAVAQQLIREGLDKTIRSYEDNIQGKEASLAVLDDSLSRLRREFGIYNIMGQTEALPSQVSETEGMLIRNRARLEALRATPGIPQDTIKMLQAHVAGLQEEFTVLSTKMQNLNEGLGKFGIFERQFIEANQTLSEDKERLKQTQALYASDIPAIVIVEEAQVPVIKSRPKRSIIVLAAGAIAFFFSILGVLLFDTYQDVDWREVYHAR